MSANIEVSASSISDSLGSLEITPLPMHKLYFELSSVDTWYTIMREARAQFGKNWRSQSHVKRRLEHSALWKLTAPTERVWFEVPDPKFGTWIAIKHAVRQVEPSGK